MASSDWEFEDWYKLNTQGDDADARSPRDEAALQRWFRDLYEECGPVGRDEIDAALLESRTGVIGRAIAGVIDDLARATGLRPVAAVETRPALGISYLGVGRVVESHCSLSAFAIDEVDLFVVAADDMQEFVIEDLTEVWPTCPEHGLGLHPKAHDEAAVWWCRAAGHAVATIGRLPR